VRTRNSCFSWPVALMLVGLLAGCGGGHHGGKGKPADDVLVAPTVTLVSPADLSTNNVVGGVIVATFSTAMDPLTVNSLTFTVQQGVAPQQGVMPVPGSVVLVGNTATFTPTPGLLFDTQYVATITTGASDLAGTGLESFYVWSFTTEEEVVVVDDTPPTVILVSPLDLATLVPIDTTVVATFSEEMAPLTLTDLSFTVTEEEGPPVAGMVVPVGDTATFTPTIALLPGTQYSATITTAATDLAGNALVNEYVWSFTTEAQEEEPGNMLPVVLGELEHFVIMGGYAVTNIPTSLIVGDLGISPSAESLITGFGQTDATGYATSPQVTGFIYAADMAAPTPAMLTLAKGDLTIAYEDAKGRTPVPTGDFLNPGGGNLGGLNLVPGLYKFTGDAIATTDFALTGGANDVWIFQIASSLVVSNGVQLTLAGGASPKNVFWQVGTQATLGTTVSFQGTLMAEASITMQTGATLVGRVLAFSGTIALDQNIITIPE